jgi:DNA-binding PadR family transcriptional regulator
MFSDMSGDWFSWLGQWRGVGFGVGQRGRFFESGEIRLAILSLLSEGPKHGYQLMKEMKERSGGMYRASAGSVYPTLQQLEDEGLIESERENGRRVYKLTVAGHTELESDPEGVRRIWQRAESWEDWGHCMGPEVIAIFGPVGAMVKSAFRTARWAAGRPEREEKLRGIIQRTSRELDDLMKG